jgi:plasmid stability protein
MEPKWNPNGGKSAMATTITVKNIPENLYRKLKTSAKRHRRSLNSEIIALLEARLAARRRSADEIIAAAGALRERTRGIRLADEDIERAIKEGRR